MAKNFEEQLTEFISGIPERKKRIKGEEATKTSLVLPFLKVLGYDYTDPSEVNPEYDAVVGTKKGEKVDYAIMNKDEKPIIFIECKATGCSLDDERYYNQLFRYFTAPETGAIIGILTDGLVYKFYSDIKSKNRMDKDSFFTIDLEHSSPEEVSILKKFHKDEFDPDAIVPHAESLMMGVEIKKALEQEMENPSEEFKILLIKKKYHGRITTGIIEKFSPIITTAIRTMIKEWTVSGLESAKAQIMGPDKKEEPEIMPDNDNGIKTTEEEILGFNIIQAICSRVTSPERIFIRDSKTYCAVLLDDNNRKSICRMYFNSKTTKNFVIFDENGTEVKNRIENVSDIYYYQDQLCDTVKRYL